MCSVPVFTFSVNSVSSVSFAGILSQSNCYEPPKVTGTDNSTKITMDGCDSTNSRFWVWRESVAILEMTSEVLYDRGIRFACIWDVNKTGKPSLEDYTRTEEHLQVQT